MKNILIVCSAGASSGFLAKTIRQEVSKRGLPLNFKARSYSEAEEYMDEIDLLLIGPHLSYMMNDFIELGKEYGVPSQMISKEAYGEMNAGEIIDTTVNYFKSKGEKL